MRALIYFPIIHSPQDLGSLSKAARELRSDAQENKYLDAVKQFSKQFLMYFEHFLIMQLNQVLAITRKNVPI